MTRGIPNLSRTGRKLPWTSFCSGTSGTLLPRTLLTATPEVGYHKIPGQKNDLALTNFFCKFSENTRSEMFYSV